jgi:ribonuclease P protein component
VAPNDGARKDTAHGADDPPRAAHTLPRARRIRKRAEFVEIQQSAARVTTRNLLMLLALRPGDGPARLGVVASRKVGPAVARNRAKRLVREAFRANPDIFPARLDVVIVVRPGTHQLDAEELAEQVRRARPHLERRAAELARVVRPRTRPARTPQGARGSPGEENMNSANDTRDLRNAGDRGDRGVAGDRGDAITPPEEHALDRLRRH